MTKAITNTTNPHTGRPYSLYNYAALLKVIGGSGLFVRVTEEDIEHTTSAVGAEFGVELLEGLLGLAAGEGALSFAQDLLSSMRTSALKMSARESSSDSKVANIIFICEYLLGMPMISALVVYADVTSNIQQIRIGPCFSEESHSSTWIMHKDTYMFVTPKFIKEYSGDLDSGAEDVQYNLFVD